MKNLKSIYFVITILTAIGMAVGSGWFGWDPVYSQIGIFISAGLGVLYYKQDELKIFDLLLLPLAMATIFYQGLTSLCFDLAIYYYIIYRFGPNTETNGSLGITLFIPLLFTAKMMHILPEAYVTVASWVTLAFISLNWPLKKFEYANSKPWLEWFYCLIAIGLFFDNQLYNYYYVQYGVLALSVIALLSHLPKLSMLFALLTLQVISGFDPEVNVLLYSTIWFEVYGAMIFFVMTPFFTKQPVTSTEDIATFYSALSMFYFSVSGLFEKQSYKRYWQLTAVLFVLTVIAFEKREHWELIRDNFAVAAWFSLIPALAAFLASYLVYKKIVKPLQTKYSISELTYGQWQKTGNANIQTPELLEFTPEREVSSGLREPTVLLIIVGLALFTMGFLWLASIA